MTLYDLLMSDSSLHIPPRSLRSLSLSYTERMIFARIRNRNGLSRVEIARDLGISKGGVSKALAKLSKAGLIDEQRDPIGNGQIGQPAIRIMLRSDSLRFVGLNLSTRGCFCAVTDLLSKPLWLSPAEELGDGVGAITSQAVALAERGLVEAGRGSDIGLFVPAIFSASGEIVEVMPRQTSVPFTLIKERLERNFPDSRITLSSRAEVMHAALEPRNFGQVLFHLSLGDGIGGQIFDRNRIFTGGFNQAGNIGGLMPEPGPRPSIPDLASVIGYSAESLSLDVLSELFAKRHPILLEWIATRADHMSPTLSAVVQLINPHKLVFGGNFPREILSALADRIDLSRNDAEGRMPLDKPKIEISNILGEAARAVAASTLPLATFLFEVA